MMVGDVSGRAQSFFLQAYSFSQPQPSTTRRFRSSHRHPPGVEQLDPSRVSRASRADRRHSKRHSASNTGTETCRNHVRSSCSSVSALASRRSQHNVIPQDSGAQELAEMNIPAFCGAHPSSETAFGIYIHGFSMIVTQSGDMVGRRDKQICCISIHGNKRNRTSRSCPHSTPVASISLVSFHHSLIGHVTHDRPHPLGGLIRECVPVLRRS
jgi:hypothetical protein